MVDLLNIKHDEDRDKIVIDFSYEGIGINIDKAQFELDKDAWIEFKKMNVPDVDMIKTMLEREFLYLSEWLD